MCSPTGRWFFCPFLPAYWIRFCLFDGTPSFPLRSYLWLGAIAIVLFLATYAIAGLYASYRAIRFHREAQTLFLATILDMLILITSLFVFRLNEMSRWLLVFYCGIVYCVLVCKRAALRLTLRHYRRLGYNQKHVLVVGDGEMAAAYIRRVREDRDLGFLVDGYVANRTRLPNVRRLGGYDQLEELLTERNPDEVIVAMAPEEYALTGKVINICEKPAPRFPWFRFMPSICPPTPRWTTLTACP